MKHIIKEVLLQEAKKKVGDRCTRIAKRKYDVWPSAYASGAVVKCRQGKIWKNENLEYDFYSLVENREYENLLTEGWKENILAAITLAAGVGLNSPAKANTISSITKIEHSIKSDEQKFFAACLQFSAELNQGSDMGFEQKKGLTEAGLYFQSMRDNTKPIKLTEAGAAAVKSIESTVMQMGGEKFNVLAEKGLTVKLNAEIMDKNQYVRESYLYEEPKRDFSKEKEKGLHGWFERRGGKGKAKGWVDCNTCRDGKCKPCGREEGEDRKKPRCRPTPSQCKGYKRPDQR